jgi:cysteine synthase A
MTAEEIELSRSTPSARFGAAPAPASAVAPTPVTGDAEAKSYLAEAIASQPVVVFALEWCEFCWSLRNFLEAIGLPYRAVEIDSLAMQRGELGARVRQALSAHTGSVTIPQVFIGGQYAGGCIDIFDAFREGALQRRLAAAGVILPARANVDPFDLLPKWLAKREPA